ncbi:MAG: thiol:disulfide interchange protein DsbA/DsbL [Gammaproteobacteria bacterium]
MMHRFFRLTVLTLTLFFSGLSFGEPPMPAGFEPISPAQPTQDPDKVEVIEFFWYGCPHCYNFEPMLNKWVENKPDNVLFIRQPAVFETESKRGKLWAQHAKAYFTAEALGVVEKVHADLFDAVQNQKPLETENQLADFFTEHGIAEKDFRNAYNSFYVDAKMRQALTMGPRYGFTGVPAVIVNGKYLVKAPLPNMIEIMDRLIREETTK